MNNISLPAYAAIIIVVKYFEGSLHVVFQVAACPEGGLNVSAYRAFIEFCTNPEEALEFFGKHYKILIICAVMIWTHN